MERWSEGCWRKRSMLTRRPRQNEGNDCNAASALLPPGGRSNPHREDYSTVSPSYMHLLGISY